MIAQEVAKKYSRALFLAAKEKRLVDEAYEQLEDLRKFVLQDRTLLNFLNAPHVLDEHKLAMIRDVFGARLHRLFVEFLVVLVEKHRVMYLPEIIEQFILLVETEKGIARVTVVTARPLGEDAERNLIRSLEAKTGLKVLLVKKVDPRILGGMIVMLHNEIIDGSVRFGLDMLEERLAKVKVV